MHLRVYMFFVLDTYPYQEQYHSVQRPKKEGVGVSKGESKRGGVIKGEGVGLRRSNKERGKSEFKEAVAEIAMEMEKVGAYSKSPSASCYTEYDQ